MSPEENLCSSLFMYLDERSMNYMRLGLFTASEPFIIYILIKYKVGQTIYQTIGVEVELQEMSLLVMEVLRDDRLPVVLLVEERLRFGIVILLDVVVVEVARDDGALPDWHIQLWQFINRVRLTSEVGEIQLLQDALGELLPQLSPIVLIESQALAH
jgi:hypothetical protein